MLFFDGALGLLLLGLWIFCIIDVITTPEDQCRNLPKMAWLFIVLLFFDIGSIVWLVAGRAWNRQPSGPALRSTFGRAPATRPSRAAQPGRRRGVPGATARPGRGAAPPSP